MFEQLAEFPSFTLFVDGSGLASIPYPIFTFAPWTLAQLALCTQSAIAIPP